MNEPIEVQRFRTLAAAGRADLVRVREMRTTVLERLSASSIWEGVIDALNALEKDLIVHIARQEDCVERYESDQAKRSTAA